MRQGAVLRTSQSMRGRVWWTAIIGSGLSVALLWLTDLPLGVPGEWTWPRLPADAQSGWNLLLALGVAAVYAGFVAAGQRRLAARAVSSVELTSWLIGLFAAGVVWVWTVQETAPPAGQFGKMPFVLYYPSSSGYFHKVRYDAPDAARFLAGYEALMAEGDVLHVGTHPPGLFLLFHALTGLQQASPGLTDSLYQWAPQSFRDAWEIVLELSAASAHPATPADGVVLWLAALLALGCAVATVWPLFGLLSWSLPRDRAWMVASLWPTVPAVAIFLPKSDAAYPLISTWLVFIIIGSWRKRSVAGAALAGVSVWLGMMASLAFLPVLLFCGLLMLIDLWRRFRHEPAARGRLLRHFAGWVGGWSVGFAVPVIALAWGAGINLLMVWWWNYHNHAGFYGQYPRTWWLWLLVNPLELSLAVGWPVALCSLLAISRTEWRGVLSQPRPAAIAAGLAVWGLLWISGKNSGEAARLWLLLMPGCVWLSGQWESSTTAAASTSSTASSTASTTQPNSPALTSDGTPAWLWILGLQLCVGILTVHRIGGFHLSAE